MAIDLTQFTYAYVEAAVKVGIWSGETAPTQFYGPINFTKLGISPPAQELERLKSNLEGSVGEDLATVQKPAADASTELAAEFDRGTPDLMALAIGADMAELAQSSSSAIDELVTTALGIWVPVASQYISAVSLKTNGDVAVAADKYEMDLVNGMIKAIHADAVGTDMKISYTIDATAGITYNAGKAKSAYVMLIGSATERVSQTRGRIVVHRANLAPNGEWDPVAGGFLRGAVSGSCETPVYAGYTAASPWSFTTTDRAA